MGQSHDTHTHTLTQSGVKSRGNSECPDRGQICAGGQTHTHTQGHTRASH